MIFCKFVSLHFKLDIPGRRMLAAHKTGSKIVSSGRPDRLFPNVAQ